MEFDIAVLSEGVHEFDMAVLSQGVHEFDMAVLSEGLHEFDMAVLSEGLHEFDMAVLSQGVHEFDMAVLSEGVELQSPELFSFPSSSGYTLHGMLYRPVTLDPGEEGKHPVLLFVYCGPQVQLVSNSYKAIR